MLGELLGSKGVFTVGCLVRGAGSGVVVGIDDELTLDRDGSIAGVVKIDPAAKSASGWLPGLIENRGSPDGRHLYWRGEFAFLELGGVAPEPVFGPSGRYRLTARKSKRQESEEHEVE